MSGSDTAATRVERARHAQAAWGQLTVHARSRKLERLRHTIAANIDRIVATISDEVGKTPLDTLTGDVMVTLEQLRFYEGNAAKILRKRSVGKPPFFFTGARFAESLGPHGVALIFAPWNYPVQLAVVPMATALFAGNAVLLKCSERAPRTAELIDLLCKEAELPEGLVQVSCEAGDAASALIDARPDFIFFTGSTRIGREVAKKAAGYLIPTALELGGKDACLVFASCDLARSVEGAVYAAFSNAGLVCVGAKRMYVEQPIYQEFLLRLVERAGTLRIGTTVDSDFGNPVFASVRELLREQVEDAVAHGAQLHAAWERDANVLPPLVLTDVPEIGRASCRERV